MKTILRSILLTGILPTFTIAADETDTIMTYSWQTLADAGQLTTGTIVEDQDLGSVLKIENTVGESALTLLEIEAPAIASKVYGIAGQVRYEGVDEQGYLELWNHFPDGSAYFSRTLGESGPFQSLIGTSGWREFSVPFSLEADPSGPPPSRLQFNLVLPKAGTVWLSDVALKQYPSLAQATTTAGAWWSDRTGGMVGGLLGSGVGLLGAVIGTLAGTGRARRFTTSLQLLGIFVGIVCLAAGIVAVIAGQPYGVYYPLLLCGVIATVVLGALYPVVQKGYAQHELRRMQAVDA